MTRANVLQSFALLVALATVAGCKSNHLIFTTYTKVGLDISTTDAQPTSAMFGYKRFEGAIVPVDVDEQDTVDVNGKKIPADARSIYAAIDLENSWITGLRIYQIFATGAAAENAAENPHDLRRIIESLRANDTNTVVTKEDEAEEGTP